MICSSTSLHTILLLGARAVAQYTNHTITPSSEGTIAEPTTTGVAVVPSPGLADASSSDVSASLLSSSILGSSLSLALDAAQLANTLAPASTTAELAPQVPVTAISESSLVLPTFAAAAAAATPEAVNVSAATTDPVLSSSSVLPTVAVFTDDTASPATLALIASTTDASTSQEDTNSATIPPTTPAIDTPTPNAAPPAPANGSSTIIYPVTATLSTSEPPFVYAPDTATDSVLSSSPSLPSEPFSYAPTSISSSTTGLADVPFSYAPSSASTIAPFSYEPSSESAFVPFSYAPSLESTTAPFSFAPTTAKSSEVPFAFAPLSTESSGSAKFSAPTGSGTVSIAPAAHSGSAGLSTHAGHVDYTPVNSSTILPTKSTTTPGLLTVSLGPGGNFMVGSATLLAGQTLTQGHGVSATVIALEESGGSTALIVKAPFTTASAHLPNHMKAGASSTTSSEALVYDTASELMVNGMTYHVNGATLRAEATGTGTASGVKATTSYPPGLRSNDASGSLIVSGWGYLVCGLFAAGMLL